jgi:hypothetical protein
MKILKKKTQSSKDSYATRSKVSHKPFKWSASIGTQGV